MTDPIKIYRRNPPVNLCTIDHLINRLNLLRKELVNNEERTVLACWKCNNRRGKEDVARLSIVELHKRSGRGIS